MKVAVVGAGYVGLSIASLISQNAEVVILEPNIKKVKMINNHVSPISDEYIKRYLKEKQLNLKATTNFKTAFVDTQFIIICTPTDYDEKKNSFDTSSIEDTIEKIISLNLDVTIVVKSTIPVGFIQQMKQKYHLNNIFFCPEFLREGYALYDNLYPSRIIIGSKSKEAKKFGKFLMSCVLKKDTKIKYTGPNEAEAIKLFANTYLALRVAYFNELDTFAELNNLNTRDIIDGVCLDQRIGTSYNNPSFGYGGYCLPKDAKQLLSTYENVPQHLIRAVIDSNKARKNHIFNMILRKKPKIVGIYRLTMKSNSDNFRNSAIHDIIKELINNNIKVIIYEPLINEKYFNNILVINNLELFKSISDIIVANRCDECLFDVLNKVYTRDIYKND